MRMHAMRATFATIVLVTLTACAPTLRPRAAVVYVDAAPPPPRVEVIGVAPGPRYVWIVGRWNWNRREFVWAPGAWVVVAQGYHEWVPGGWQHDRRGWFWVEGHWR